MSRGKVLRNNSVLKEDSTTQGLRTAILCRISDPSMRDKNKKGTKADTGGEIAKSIKLQKKNMQLAFEKLGIPWNEAYVIGDKKHQHTTQKYVKDVRDREDYPILEQWILNGEIDAVMVAYVDRVGRFGPVSRAIFDLLRVHGIRLFVLEQEYDLNDPDSVFLLGIQIDLAELGSSKMHKRAHEVRIEDALNGIYHYGRPPFPYMKNPNGGDPYYIQNPEQMLLFREIRALYMENGGNNRNTTDRLSLQYGKSLATINRILFGECYHTGKRKVTLKSDEPVLEYKTFDQEIEVGELEIIGTEEEYRELIRIRDSRKGGNRKSNKYEYLLSRAIRCGNCGQWMSGYTKRSGVVGYLCYTDDYNGRKKLGSRRKNGCNLWVPARPLEEAFMKELQYVFEDPQKLETALGKEGQRYQEIKNTQKIFKSRQAEIDSAYKGIRYGISGAKGNLKLIDSLLADSEKLADEEEKINQQLQELADEEKQLRSIAHLNPRLPTIVKHINQAGGFKGYSFKERKKLLGYIFPPSHPMYRKYGVTVTKVSEDHYHFKTDCLMSSDLFGELWKTEEGWEAEGSFHGKSSFSFG